ncbi:HEAT repeat domain-containing protein [Moorena producens JHB]|uniref:HEAT repeat domain-containing protein n=1 Tax=Moorena producens (strain JHB) TaxID=1454205 RepID=A0A1D9G7M3_MOOP1|nr:HEAT repeat domain-containing protein [Moorena producens]AOY83642.1 HEAT repeat domain-containing protein [Moorena producens JHB]
MDKRFANIFNLTEDQAITLLKTPLDQLEDQSDRYLAASHLINFPTERSINALMETVQEQNSELYHRIARRKAVESLGRLKASVALPIIRSCLGDEDCYTVENAVWAIGEIGTQDPEILEEIAQLLEKPGQTYRVIIQTLGALDYKPALERIKTFAKSDNEPIASAAIATVCRFTGDTTEMHKVMAFLQHSSVNARRACIQDLIDARYYQAIPKIATCPISMVFRIRGIRLLAEAGLPAGDITFEEIEPSLDQVILDHPDHLELVHEYDQMPSLDFLINELYHTDFGRCYLASKTLLKLSPDTVAEALLTTYADKAHNDYGAHYHVVKLLGWLKYADAYDLLVEALHNKAPQFQKSRAGAAISLGNLGDERAIPLLKDSLNTKIFDLKYASLIALEQFGDTSGQDLAANDSDWLIRAKAVTKAVTSH